MSMHEHMGQNVLSDGHFIKSTSNTQKMKLSIEELKFVNSLLNIQLIQIVYVRLGAARRIKRKKKSTNQKLQKRQEERKRKWTSFMKTATHFTHMRGRLLPNNY